MNNVSLYPINISLAGKKCLIVGFGKVGRRKLNGLLNSDANQVMVLDINENSLKNIHAYPEYVKFEIRHHTQEDITDSFLVFAATNDSAVNSNIAEICKKHHILCNCITEPAKGDVQLPACVRLNSVLATISTGGLSPALAREWKTDLEQWLEARQKQAWLAGKLRSAVMNNNLTQSENAKIFNILASPELGRMLRRNALIQAHIWLDKNMPEFLETEIQNALDEYRRVFP